jgi:hypothetical protein
LVEPEHSSLVRFSFEHKGRHGICFKCLEPDSEGAYGNKSFKFFCFSRIIPEPGGYTRGGDNDELIVFTKNEGTLYISSDG